jgi:hypothetical protein
MPDPSPAYETIDSKDFFKSKDFAKEVQARKKRKKPKVKSEPIRMEVPEILVKAKHLIIKEIFGGEKAWAAAHDEDKTSAKHGLENIGAIYIGQKFTKGKPTQHLCVVVEVFKKADKSKVRRDFHIPQRIKVGNEYVLTDIRVGAPVVPQALIGADICGNRRFGPNGTPEAGSIGCFCLVKLTSEGKEVRAPHILSNSHVFGALMNPDAEFGDEVISQTPGSQGEVLAFLFDDGRSRGVDAAIAVVKTGADVDPQRHRQFQLTGSFRSASQGERVSIFGGNTKQLLFGQVASTGRTQVVPYPTSPTQTLHDVFSIINDPSNGTPFSKGGDSGSVIVSDQNEILGILLGQQGDGVVLAQGAQSIVDAFTPDTADANSFSFIPTT